MSTWINKAAAFLIPVLLAACVPAGGPAPRGAATFIGGEITAAPPAGYCVDRRASHDAAEGAVILMGRCSGGSDAAPALITVSVGGTGSSAVIRSGAKALSDYFRSPAGRAALARDGRASSVQVQKTSVADGVLVLRVADRGVGTYWRAIMALKGRLVTISVTAPEGATLDEAAGRLILDRSVASLRRSNPATVN